MTDPADASLAAYAQAADRYVASSRKPGPAVLTYLGALAALVRDGTVLEIGSGPGWDADHLESLGARVTRTDATPAFVERLQERGHPARLLDVRHDDLGGPYDAVMANAVLLHLGRDELARAFARMRRAVVENGALGVTLMEGDGDEWSTHKLDLPRHYTYWREPALVAVLAAAAWDVVSVQRFDGQRGTWLLVLARAGAWGPASRPTAYGTVSPTP